MLSGRVMLVSCQRHCNSLNPRPNRCGGGNDRDSDTLNLPNPYSEAAKISVLFARAVPALRAQYRNETEFLERQGRV